MEEGGGGLHSWLPKLVAGIPYETYIKGGLLEGFTCFTVYYNPGGHSRAASVNVTVT